MTSDLQQHPGLPDAAGLITSLGLSPHPEGGWYRETLRDSSPPGTRGAWSVIYFLLREGEHSAWHRILDAVEIWYFHAGAPLELAVFVPGAPAIETFRLGSNPAQGDHCQALVPIGAWQTARPLGPWTLVSCHVSPAFDFASFELAPALWHPAP